MEKEYLDIIWVLVATVFIVAMQGGFLCLESGVTRTKNSINVALKNAVDFTVVICLYWAVGFGLMFGQTQSGWIGTSYFLPAMTVDQAWMATFFIFQAMFCATAATIVSGAMAERVKFKGYILITILITVLIYPFFGHWSWGGFYTGDTTYLHERGFVDFAGSTVVHSVGGWVALAGILVVGPRIGRFVDGKVNNLTASNLPIAMLGLLLFVVGWVGFNGGSTLEISKSIPVIVANTIMAAAAGMATVYLVQDFVCPNGEKVVLPINGALAGMVAVTANCHAVDTVNAVIIAIIGAVVMLYTHVLLLKLRIDDAVGAVPTHLAAGIWGTLAVALFGDLEILGTGLNRVEQLMVQLQGIVVCGVWSFGVSYLLMKNINRIFPLRVSPEEEHAGLNISEHNEGTPLYDLIRVMNKQIKTRDLALRAPVEPFTEVGQIAHSYNQVMNSLEQMTRKTRQIVRDIREGIITFTEEGVLTSFNPGAEKLLQVEAVRVIGKPVSELFLESGYEAKINHHLGSNVSGFSMHGSIEFYKTDKSGRKTILEYMPYRGSDHMSESYTAVIRDVTDQRDAEEQLHLEKERAQATVESIGEGVITTDKNNCITYFNDIAAGILGISLSDSLGKELNSCLVLINEKSGKEIILEHQGNFKSNEQIKKYNQLLLKRPDNKHLSVNITSSIIKDKDHETVGSILVIQDISKSREMEELLTHQATHDSLTGLLNRVEFEKRLYEFSRRSKINNEKHSICYLDLDQFKIVNDTCGHHAGDELLRQLSAILQNKLRTGDTFARLGGDEFGILLNNCDLEIGYKIANNLRECVEEFRFPWKNKNFSVGVSIGVVEINNMHNASSEIMSMADAACYAAKDAGRNRVHVHKSDDNELQDRWGQMEWATRIQHALDENRFCLARQKIVPTKRQALNGTRYEMFVRMLDEKGDIVPPGAFIPAAERYSLMTLIDDWVIRHTLEWMQNTPEILEHIAINLSGTSINNNEFLNKLQGYLKETNVDTSKICFEITETAAIADVLQAKDFFLKLKEFGCKFSLDDFGSGLSSFGYLKSLPVDYLKIDGMFVKDILTDQVDHAMVESIHNVGRLMGLQTIAEFVENQDILNRITGIGIDFAQGYHFGKPEIIGTSTIKNLKQAG